MRASDDTPTSEHLPSCKDHCARGCAMSPTHWIPPDDAPRPPRVRTLHTAPVPPVTGKPPAPLWERIDDWDAVRQSGAPIPLPETYTAFARMDERYSLDRWTRPDGVKDRELDAAIRERESSGRRQRAPRDVAEVAYLLRAAFPGVERTASKGGRMRDLFRLAIGDDPAAALPEDTGSRASWEAVAGQGGLYVGLVWGLALVLFGRDRDTVPEHAIGRMLPGEPIRDVRPPFASAGHALAVASAPLPGLGGGSCPWPQDDPRMRQRTWAKPGEMTVRAGHAGSDHIRGEQAVHRVLSARAAVRRAGLTTHEQAAVEVLASRDMSRDEKATALRDIEAARYGGDPDVTTSALFKAAAAAERRLRAAVERESKAGDALAPKRPEKPRKVRPVHVAHAPVRHSLPMGCL